MIALPLGARTLMIATTVAMFGPVTVSPRGTTLVAGVADAATGAAIAGAEVLLPDLGMSGRTDALGEARISGIPAGSHLVRVRFLGYAPSEIHLRMRGDTAGAVFRLERVAVPLDAVKINERWVPIRLKDFENRRRQGIGRFLVAEDLGKIGLQIFPLAIPMRFPGLRSYTDLSGNWHIASTRDYLNVATGVAPCDLQVYLDDMPLGDGDLNTLRTWDLDAVEFYTPPQVPVRYRTKRYGCGILLLWSKW